jgi:hypothetical protein
MPGRIVGLPLVLVGLLLIMYRDAFARRQLDFQRNAFGVDLRPAWVGWNRFIALAVGVFFIAFGVVILIVGL